ncbi:MAG: hypothetical protein J6S21_06590 [Victivallales bacterium]|nr:hypothetical protein [Victivallales bacterium]
MKFAVAFLSLICAVAVMAADDPSLLFKVHFDSYHVTADFAKGNPKSRNFNADLQLRMHPGIDGKGNSIRLSGKEFCSYNMKGNFNPQRGTVNFWLSADNWTFNDKNYHVFFEAKQGDYRFIIYKYATNPFVCVYLQSPDGTEAINAWLDVNDWMGKKWHMVTAIWDVDSMTVFIDGKRPKNYAPGNAHPAFPYKRFNTPKKLPEATSKGLFGIGNLFGGWKIPEEDQTAIDELEIYDRCLNPAEITALYEAKRPQKNEQLAPHEMLVPKASPITLDGVLGEEEYADAAWMPMLKAYKTANHNMQNNTGMRLKSDGKFLYAGFITDLPVTRKAFTQNDQNIYSDDIFEFFILDDTNQKLWFCVNANGAIMDAKNGDRKWNSGAKAAARQLEKGWCAEIAVPLEALGSPGAGDKRRANFRALNFASVPNYYMSWNGSPEMEEGTSTIVFSGDASMVSLKSLGDIYKGIINTDIVGGQKLTMLLNGKEIPCRNGNFQSTVSAGKYQLELTGESFNYNLDFYVNFPLTATIKSYPASGYVEVKSDLGNAGGEVLGNLAAYTGRITLAKEGRTVSEIAFKPELVSYSRLPLPAGIESGKYEINVAVDGPKSLKYALAFRVPDMTPYCKRVAVDHNVPEPWTKVEVADNNTFKVLDRTYTFNQSPFPAAMESRGDKVLSAQPVLTIDGAPVKWFGREITQRFDDYVTMEGRGRCGNLSFTWRGELWFDGLWKLDFDMTPEVARAISAMQLKWSVPANSAKCYISRLGEGFVVTPWDKNGIISKALNLQDGCWLTGHITGMMWQPLSGANWVGAGNKATFLQQNGDNVDVNLNIIAKQVTLNKRAAYSIGFMATPGKRPPADFRTVNEGSYMNNPQQRYQISSTGGNTREDAVRGYASHIMRYPDKYREKWIKPYLKRGVTLFPYHQPKGITLLDDEWDFYLAEWRTNPGYIQASLPYEDKILDFVHCCGDGIADLMAYRLEKLFLDFPELGGIYYDISDVRTCDNTYHGHGGTDAFGQHYFDSTAMTFRQYMMRIYKVCHKYGKRTFIHAHNYFNPIAHNFTDIWYPGEEFVWHYGNDPDHFYSEIPLAELQYAYSPTVRGAAIIRCNQVSRVLFMDKLKPRKQELEGEKMAIRSFVSTWLHDFNMDSDWINDRAVSRVWTIKNELNFNEAEFHGYWFDDTVKSSSKRVFCSWYDLKHPKYSHLIIVGNMGRQDQPAALDINWQKLGIDNPAKVKITELWDKKPVSVQQLKDINVPENHFLLLGIEK